MLEPCIQSHPPTALGVLSTQLQYRGVSPPKHSNTLWRRGEAHLFTLQPFLLSGAGSISNGAANLRSPLVLQYYKCAATKTSLGVAPLVQFLMYSISISGRSRTLRRRPATRTEDLGPAHLRSQAAPVSVFDQSQPFGSRPFCTIAILMMA